jgi:phosphatidylcholine synthase
MTHPHPSIPLGRRAAAFSVHLLTALGAVLALLALRSAHAGEWADMFLWLGLAMLIDAVDGPLARALKAAEALPRWSGATIDLVVDYLNYVLVPAAALALGPVLPERLAFIAAAAIVISGAIYFGDTRMRTDDGYFRGFPALWNVVAFYLFLLQPTPYVALAVVALFIGLTFAPIVFIHPLRAKRWRPLNGALTVIWAVLAIMTLVQDLTPSPTTSAGLIAIGVYFLLAGVARRRTG